MYIFNSLTETLTVVLRPKKKLVVGSQVVVEDGLVARFDHGIFTTEDEEAAKLLREKISKTHDRTIVEIGSEEERAFERAAKVMNTREAMSAPSMSKTLNPSIAERAPAEKIICPICDPEKEFKSQKDLNLHLLSHRPGVSVAERPAAQAAVVNSNQTEPLTKKP